MPSEESLYGLWHIAEHLAGDARIERLEHLMADLNFLSRKLATCGIPALITDFDYLPASSPLREAQAAVRLSTQALERTPVELAGQLLGRLPPPAAGHSPLARLLRKARARATQLLPLTSSLAPAEGAMRQTFRPGGRGLVISSDGRYVISGAGRRIWIWDLTGAQVARTVARHERPVTTVELTPGNEWLITADETSTLAVFSFASGQRWRSWKGHEGRVVALAALPDGRRFLSAGPNGLIKLWDLRDGTELRVLREDTAEVVALAVTPDGSTAISGSRDGTIRLWDLDHESPARILPGTTNAISSLALSADGRHLAVSGSTGVLIWDLPAGVVVQTLAVRNRAADLAISPDGRCLATLADSEVRLWNLDATSDGRLAARGSSTGHIAFAPSGDLLVTAAGSEVRVWDLTREVGMAPAGDLSALSITSDGRFAVTGSADGAITIWDLTSGREVERLSGAEKSLSALAVTPDGRQVFAGDRKGGIHRFDLGSGERLPAPEGFDADDAVRAIAVTGDGRHLVAGSTWGDILIWDLEQRRLVGEHRMAPAYLIALALVPGTLQAIVCLHHEDDQSPLVLDLADGRRLRRLEKHNEALLAVAVTADGRLAATGTVGGSLKVWDLGGRNVRSLRGHDGGVTSVAFPASGRHVVSASDDRTVRLWDLATKRCLATFTGDSGIRRCAVTPDGRTIVAAGSAGELHFLRWSGQGSSLSSSSSSSFSSS